MTLGIQNATNVTIENINTIINVSSPEQFFLNVNVLVYSGWLYFILMCVLVFVLYTMAQEQRDEPLNNLFISFLITSVLSLMLRAIYGVIFGVEQALLSDMQLWVFPIATAVLGALIWSTRREND
jgi:lipoprotein signal peptidase